ncbi:unnamed protein product [Gadus morhua 'NCC']
MLWFWVFTLSRTGFPCWVEDLGVALTVPAGGSGLGRDLSYGQRGPQTSRGFRVTPADGYLVNSQTDGSSLTASFPHTLTYGPQTFLSVRSSSSLRV